MQDGWQLMLHSYHMFNTWDRCIAVYLRVGYVESEADFQQDKCVSRCYAVITKGRHSSMTGIF